MGGITSCFGHPHDHSGGMGNRTSKIRGHKRNLSATFNVQDVASDVPMEQLNVNTATEEELMTLPGIDRQTAHNIVDYRQQIGHFRKIEDLALVSGVGATKLNQIRFEICVCNRRRGSQNSSPTGSKHDLSTERSSARSTPIRVNLNTSNVFQLMKVKSISQQLAENIVTYRDKKGPFKSIDDLVKVKGIKNGILSAIRPNLVLGNEPSPIMPLSKPANGNLHFRQSSQTSFKYLNGDSLSFTGTPIHMLSSDAIKFHYSSHNNIHTNLYPNLSADSTEDILSVYGPLISKSERQNVVKFDYQRDCRPAVRVATWNLQKFSKEKASNPGVKEVICMTLLEQGISLLCVQEIGDKQALQIICNELNNPTLPKVKKWRRQHGLWKSCTSDNAGRMHQSSEFLGYLFDCTYVKLIDNSLLEISNTSSPFTRKPYIATFKVGALDMVLVGIHLKAAGYGDRDLDRLKDEVIKLPDVVTAINNYLPGEKDVVVLGDFNLNPDAQDFEAFQNNGLTNIVPCTTFTNISMKQKQGNQNYDNFWLSKSIRKLYTGVFEVVRTGLTSPWIPDGWSWGGLVSDHCPVWIELYTDKDLDKGDVNKTLS